MRPPNWIRVSSIHNLALRRCAVAVLTPIIMLLVSAITAVMLPVALVISLGVTFVQVLAVILDALFRAFGDVLRSAKNQWARYN
jgi:membrane protein implicated in regulation of membrane protease activity